VRGETLGIEMGKSRETRHHHPPIITRRAREMRHEPSPAERVLWFHLRGGKTGFKFRRQHPVGWFIADFYCAQSRLIVELDGPSHDHSEDYDDRRPEWLMANGHEVVRFSNDDVMKNTEGVVAEIERVCAARALPSP
jgi:very-short-patch-repair endonuclease